eukprot:CAMPEP_0170498530 /NCGR_PEP_ID=MMETSP0208-20121228/28053_1 /TAXON_ID=197538 /ORGANISM="Strombidium inclinatum, Strain S3" /LENGTH=121 /DNA_ID=CAMNT_0010775725 /DNA_START=1053 /DNA_END=1418 /DNA_ORIENTATION=+
MNSSMFDNQVNSSPMYNLRISPGLRTSPPMNASLQVANNGEAGKLVDRSRNKEVGGSTKNRSQGFSNTYMSRSIMKETPFSQSSTESQPKNSIRQKSQFPTPNLGHKNVKFDIDQEDKIMT